VYFGLLFVMNCSIGLLTPPVGTVLNVAAGVGKTSMEGIIKGVTPFLIAQTVVMILLILFPSLVTTPLEWFHK
jgi:TRAP-type C4-dicarboxylate transport system permease large subunit